MLHTLIVQNYSLIESLHIDFQNGFSVITGETGAGKSIMLGALGLLLGQRADSKAIRSGAQKCVIEGHFSLNSNRLESFFTENDFEYDAECIVRREVYASGKSRAFINDTPAQLSQLKELGEQLIDIHSQHKNLLLNKEDFQLDVLDLIAHNEDTLSAYTSAYSSYRKLQKELKEARSLAQKSKEEEDFLRFQCQQLEEANLQAGEQEDLEQELEILTHAEEIKESLFRGSNQLQEAENSILSQLKELQSNLRSIEGVFSPTKEWLERLDSATIELKDIAEELDDKSEDVEFNPQRLEFVNERLNTIYTLEKKHGKQTVEELLEYQEEIEKKLNLIDNSDEQIQALEKELQKQEKLLRTLAAQLTKERQESAKITIRNMVANLSTLGMPNVQFDIRFTPTEGFKPKGCDEVCYLFNANKGGQLQELAQVASGGEIARVMLSLKSLMAGSTDLPTIIFDEIDTGVSGSIAEKMALIMQRMCEDGNRQVISITHLPQIAARGKVHYKVFKEDKDELTVSQIVVLTPEERIQELAHMLSGETLTEAAINNARELLKTNEND